MSFEIPFFYRVEGFEPRTDNLLGGFGFTVQLERGFASRAKQTEITDEMAQRLQEQAKEIIKSTERRDLSEFSIQKPYIFVDNSLLIQLCRVPGDACGISADHTELENLDSKRGRNWIEYNPHNVDNMKQAYQLFSIFSRWASLAEAVIYSK